EPRIDVRPETSVERDAGFRDTAALATHFLTLLRREGFEEGIEARIAAIRPVELAVAAEQPARALVRCACRIIEEEGVRGGEGVLRGKALDRRDELLRRRREVEPIADQNPWPRGWCEGHGDRELRVVAKAKARVRLRPTEVEHEFAIRMGFGERGH